MNLSLRQKSILIGTILGDGYLQKTGKENARLRLEHGFRQKEYLLWKITELKNLFQGKPKYLKRVHPISQRIYQYFRHQSQSTPYLGKLRKIFYKDNKKNIPENIEKFLYSTLALAVWYMDDGYYYRRDKCAYLYLGKVSEMDAENAQKALGKKYSLFVKILDKKQKGYALYFSRAEAEKLKLIISKHILKEFVYKLPL